MSFNTNGWDYIYTVNIKKLNDIIKGKTAQQEFKNLFNTVVEATFKDGGNDHTFEIGNYGIGSPISISSLEVLNTSHYPDRRSMPPKPTLTKPKSETMVEVCDFDPII